MKHIEDSLIYLHHFELAETKKYGELPTNTTEHKLIELELHMHFKINFSL